MEEKIKKDVTIKDINLLFSKIKTDNCIDMSINCMLFINDEDIKKYINDHPEDKKYLLNMALNIIKGIN